MQLKSEIFSNIDGNFIIFPNDGIGGHLKSGRLWEPHFKDVIDHFINENDTVIDCGANFGYNSILMGKRIGFHGKLFVFEPQRIVFQQLCGNLILNNIFNANAYQFALGENDGLTSMFPINYEKSWVNIGDLSIGQGGEEVQMMKLDNILEIVNTVDFIKLDVQGYELEVIKGAKQILSEFKPHLFVEIEDHQLAKFKISREKLIAEIKSFGYRIFNIANDYPVDFICTTNINLINSVREKLNLIEI